MTFGPAPAHPTALAIAAPAPASLWLALLSAALLAACTAPRPPSAGTASPAPAPTSQATPVRPAPSFGQGLPVTPAPNFPIVQPPPAPAPAPVATPPAASPFSPAVAARFPEPPVPYNTPGLQPGRSSFTSQPELQAWLRDLAVFATTPGGPVAQLVTYGQSQRNDTLDALVVTRSPTTPDAISLQASGRPTVLLVGQQHGDEPATAEALLVVARELVRGNLRGLLERVNVIVVPRTNPDGAAVAATLTARGIDLADDHLLLATPEARALATLVRNYRPTVVVDVREYAAIGPMLQKFGALPRADALLQNASAANQPEFLGRAAEEWLRQPMVAALKAQGLTHEWSHTTSPDLKDRVVGMGGTQPGSLRNASALKNSVSVVVESRGAGLERQNLQRRVHTLVTALSASLRGTANRANELNQLRAFVDRDVSSQACRGEAVVESGLTPVQYDLTLINPQTGADRTLSVDWLSALALRKVKVRPRPCGYLLSASSTDAAQRLRLQGVQVWRVMSPGSVLGDTYAEVPRATPPGQAYNPTSPDLQVARSAVDAPTGSFYIPLTQPLANLVLAALEPDAPGSFHANRILGALQGTTRVMGEPTLKLEELP